jgi:SAM-dependent methyltransferase
MGISPEEIRYGYLFAFGREPESAEVAWHAYHTDVAQFRRALLGSKEFRGKYSAFAPGVTGHPFATWTREALAFIHVPKTGGSTLTDLLSTCFDSAQICPERVNLLHLYSMAELASYDLFAGHFDYLTTSLIPRYRVRRISLLRDPIQRLISLYRFSRSHLPIGDLADDEVVKLANALSPEDFFEDERITSLTSFNNSYLFTFGSSLDDRIQSLESDVFCTEALAIASQRVAELDAIGLTERFEDSVEVIFNALGFEVPLSINPLMITDELPNTLARAPRAQMTSRLSQALQPLTRYDQVIYQAAGKELDRRYSARPSSLVGGNGATGGAATRVPRSASKVKARMSDSKKLAEPDDVIQCYRLFLRREPENSEVIDAHLRNRPTLWELLHSFAVSAEYEPIKIDEACSGLWHRQDGREVEVEASATAKKEILVHVRKIWSAYGSNDPYYSVLTDPGYRATNMTSELTNKFYESGANGVSTLRLVFERNRIEMSPFWHVLDLGCGIGRIGEHFCKIFEYYHGVDISHTHLELARQRFEEKNITNAKLLSLEDAVEQECNFDLFYSIIVLQHNPPPIIDYLLNTFLSKLKPGGYAFFQLPCHIYGYSFNVNQYLGGYGKREAMEMHALPQKYVFEALYRNGLRPIEVCPFPVIGPIGISYLFLAHKTENTPPHRNPPQFTP